MYPKCLKDVDPLSILTSINVVYARRFGKLILQCLLAGLALHTAQISTVHDPVPSVEGNLVLIDYSDVVLCLITKYNKV